MYEDATGKLNDEQRAHVLAAKVLLTTAADITGRAIAALTWAGVAQGDARLEEAINLRSKALDAEFNLAEWLAIDAERKS